MLLDAWLLDAPLTVRGMTGAIVVMASVWFGALSPSASGASTGTDSVDTLKNRSA